MSLPIGKQNITGDSTIGGSGKRIRLYGLICRASGSDAVIAVYDGTSNAGTQVDTVNVTASTTNRVAYPGGLMLESGCFLDVDANTSYVTAIYEQENG